MLNWVYWKYSCVLSQIFDSQCQNVKHKHLWSSGKRSPWAGVQRRGYWEKCTHGSVDFIQTSSLCRKMLGKYLGVLSCRRSRIDARKISCKWIKVVDIFSVKADCNSCIPPASTLLFWPPQHPTLHFITTQTGGKWKYKIFSSGVVRSSKIQHFLIGIFNSGLNKIDPSWGQPLGLFTGQALLPPIIMNSNHLWTHLVVNWMSCYMRPSVINIQHH